jgi:hypothetical protein
MKTATAFPVKALKINLLPTSLSYVIQLGLSPTPAATIKSSFL